MLLTLDMGNTNITIGVFDGSRLLFESRVATDRSRMEDQYAAEFRNIFRLYQVDDRGFEGAVLGSVVPPLDNAIRRAVTYPAVMATLIALVFLVLVSRVLPVFSQVFSQLGAGLSPVAAALLSSGSTGQIIAYILSGLLLAGAVALLLFFRGERGVRLFSRGATVEAVARGRFSSAMALMLQSGLPLDEAMERTSELLEGSPLAERFLDCRRRVSEGASFPCAVEDAGVLTGLQAGLLAAGFRTGVSEEAMAELARRCQAEADERLSRLLSRFEYLLVIVLCAAVGLVLLSVMLPLLGVLSAIGG